MNVKSRQDNNNYGDSKISDTLGPNKLVSGFLISYVCLCRYFWTTLA